MVLWQCSATLTIGKSRAIRRLRTSQPPAGARPPDDLLSSNNHHLVSFPPALSRILALSTNTEYTICALMQHANPPLQGLRGMS